MMDFVGCEARDVFVCAYVDGELAEEDRQAFERHLGRCDRCRTMLRREQDLLRMVEAAGPLHEPSNRLRAAVADLVDSAVPTRPPWRARLPALAPLAAAVLGVGMLLWGSGSRVNLVHTPTLSEFASLGVDTHLQQVRGQLPLEVRSACPRDVAGWFAGRLPFQFDLADPPAGPGEQSAYSLVGGRLIPFHGEHAAYVLYSVDERPVSLLVTSAAAFEPGGGSTLSSGPLTFHVESVAGLRVISWSDRGLTYALVSDMQADGARSCLVCHGSQNPAIGAPLGDRGGRAPRPGRVEAPRGCRAS